MEIYKQFNNQKIIFNDNNNLNNEEINEENIKLECDNSLLILSIECLENNNSPLFHLTEKYTNSPLFPILFYEYLLNYLQKYMDYDLLNYVISGPLDNSIHLAHSGILNLLISNIPNSFITILEIFKKYSIEAPYIFIRNSGLYSIVEYSFDIQYHLIISQLLFYLSPLEIDYIEILFPNSFSIFDLNEPSIDLKEFKFIDLINNLFESDNNEVIINLLKSLHLMFERRISSCIIIGPIFFKYLSKFILNEEFSIYVYQTATSCSRAIPSNYFISFFEFLIESIKNNFNINEKFILISLEFINNILEIFINEIFNYLEFIEFIFFQIFNSTFKLKKASISTIISILKYSNPEQIRILISMGIINILIDFLPLSTDDLLLNILQSLNFFFNKFDINLLKDLELEKFEELIKFIEDLIDHKNQIISNHSKSLLLFLKPLYFTFNQPTK